MAILVHQRVVFPIASRASKANKTLFPLGFVRWVARNYSVQSRANTGRLSSYLILFKWVPIENGQTCWTRLQLWSSSKLPPVSFFKRLEKESESIPFLFRDFMDFQGLNIWVPLISLISRLMCITNNTRHGGSYRVSQDNTRQRKRMLKWLMMVVLVVIVESQGTEFYMQLLMNILHNKR